MRRRARALAEAAGLARLRFRGARARAGLALLAPRERQRPVDAREELGQRHDHGHARRLDGPHAAARVPERKAPRRKRASTPSGVSVIFGGPRSASRRSAPRAPRRPPRSCPCRRTFGAVRVREHLVREGELDERRRGPLARGVRRVRRQLVRVDFSGH